MGLAVAMVIALAVHAPEAAAKDEWLSQHYRDHPLAGTIWTADFQPATIDQVEAAVAKAGFVLLGETHTNPDHHRLQARMIATLVRNGRRPAVVFEMIPANLQADLDRHLQAGPVEAGSLGKVLRWEERGWPAWTIYQPIAEAALAAGLPLKAGSLDREAQKALSKGDPQVLEQFGLTQPLEPRIAEAQARELKEGHCNLLPDASIEPMIRVQRARDAHLAQAMMRAAKPEDGAVLIAGAGHVRQDWAVPPVIRRALPEQRIVSIAFFEVDEKMSAPADYVQALAGLPKPYDFLYFTPKADLTDHCAELEKHFKGKKAKQGG